MYSTVTFYNSQHLQTVPEIANPVDQLQGTALVPSHHNCSSPVTKVVTPHAASHHIPACSFLVQHSSETVRDWPTGAARLNCLSDLETLTLKFSNRKRVEFRGLFLSLSFSKGQNNPFSGQRVVYPNNDRFTVEEREWETITMKKVMFFKWELHYLCILMLPKEPEAE